MSTIEQAIANGKPNPRYNAKDSKAYGSFLRSSKSSNYRRAYKSNNIVSASSLPQPTPAEQPQKLLEPSLPKATPLTFYEQGQFNLQSVPVKQSFQNKEQERLASIRVSQRQQLQQRQQQNNTNLSSVPKRQPLPNESQVPQRYNVNKQYTDKNQLVNKISSVPEQKGTLNKYSNFIEQKRNQEKFNYDRGEQNLANSAKYIGSSILWGGASAGANFAKGIKGVWDTKGKSLVYPLTNPVETEESIRNGVSNAISETKNNPFYSVSKIGGEFALSYKTGEIIGKASNKIGIKPIREKVLSGDITTITQGRSSPKVTILNQIEDRPTFRYNPENEITGVYRSSDLSKARLDLSSKISTKPSNIFYGTEDIFKTQNKLSIPETNKVASGRFIINKNSVNSFYSEDVSLFPFGKKTIDVIKNSNAKETNVILSSPRTLADSFIDNSGYFEKLSFKGKGYNTPQLELLNTRKTQAETSQIGRGTFTQILERKSRAYTPKEYTRVTETSGTMQDVMLTPQGNIFREFGLNAEGKPDIIRYDINLVPSKVKFIKGTPAKTSDAIKINGYSTQEIINPYSNEIIKNNNYVEFESAYNLKGKTINKPFKIEPVNNPISKQKNMFNADISKYELKESLKNLKSRVENNFLGFNSNPKSQELILYNPVKKDTVTKQIQIQEIKPQNTANNIKLSRFDLITEPNYKVMPIASFKSDTKMNFANSNIKLYGNNFSSTSKQSKVLTPLSIPKQSVFFKPVSINKTIPKSIYVQKSAIIQQNKQAQRQIQVSKQIELQIPKTQRNILTNSRPLKMFKSVPKPAKFPFFTKFDVKKNKANIGFFPTFNVQVRKKGKFVNVGRGLTRGEALNFGSRLVDNSTARTFRLSKSGITTRNPFVSGFESLKYKQKRPNMFIERSKYAISTGGEKSQLKIARNSARNIFSRMF